MLPGVPFDNLTINGCTFSFGLLRIKLIRTDFHVLDVLDVLRVVGVFFFE